ncbi:MAG: hypothetical protein GXO88_13820 [Chlorobi bacterium]|nr:hypothetical protein [Chlorobiota bacterium]
MTDTKTHINGWTEVILKEIVKINSSTISKNYSFNEIEYIDIASVENRNIQQIKRLKLSEAPSRAKRIVTDESTLINKISFKEYL